MFKKLVFLACPWVTYFSYVGKKFRVHLVSFNIKNT